jgi:hypothetical protein
MKGSDRKQLCSIRSARTLHLEMICLMIILLVVTLDRRIANAGLVIEQRVTMGAAGAPGRTINRTLMVQGDKEKFEINDHQSLVFDASAETVTALDSQSKIFRELPFRKVMGTALDPNRLLYMAFKSTDSTREILGSKCQDYTSALYKGPLMVVTTACFSTSPAGSDEFSRLMKSVIQHLRRRARGVVLPDGIPLVIESTRRANPSFTPVDVPEKEALIFKSRIAKIPPQLTRQEVTKITSATLTPDVFNTPAGYTRRGAVPD